MKQIIERLQILSGFNGGRCKHVALSTHILEHTHTRTNTFRLFNESPIFIVFEDVSECFAYLLARSFVRSTHFRRTHTHTHYHRLLKNLSLIDTFSKLMVTLEKLSGNDEWNEIG